MVKVALAGGSANLGRAIADGLVEKAIHEFIILTRRKGICEGPENLNSVDVNYEDVTELKEKLEAHQIEVVISALPISDDASGQAQLNLIAAAEKSEPTKRFLPSEFGMLYKPERISHLPAYNWKLRAAEELEKSSLEYSLVSIGMFLDYWSTPRVPTRLSVAPNMWLDLENNFASIPGDGEDYFVVTHSRDAGRFAAELLDLSQWSRRHFVIGNRVTMNQAVKIAEEAKGVKFDVRYNRIEDLNNGNVILTPRMAESLSQDEGTVAHVKKMVAQTGVILTKGYLDLDPEHNLTKKFPHLNLLTLKEVAEAWKDPIPS